MNNICICILILLLFCIINNNYNKRGEDIIDTFINMITGNNASYKDLNNYNYNQKLPFISNNHKLKTKLPFISSNNRYVNNSFPLPHLLSHEKIPTPIIDYDLTKILKQYTSDNNLLDGTIIINKEDNKEDLKDVFKIRHPWYSNQSSEYANVNNIDKLPNPNINPIINKGYINKSPIIHGYHFINNGEYDNLYQSDLYSGDINTGLLEYNNIQDSLLGESIPNKMSTSKFTQIDTCFK